MKRFLNIVIIEKVLAAPLAWAPLHWLGGGNDNRKGMKGCGGLWTGPPWRSYFLVREKKMEGGNGMKGEPGAALLSTPNPLPPPPRPTLTLLKPISATFKPPTINFHLRFHKTFPIEEMDRGEPLGQLD